MPRTTVALPAPVSLEKLAGVYGQRIIAALPLLWARRMSMHDSRGNVHWQSTDVWSPAEREAIRLALERFVGHTAPARADHELPEQRTAVLLRATDPGNNFRGFVMLVVDNRRLRGKGQSIQDLPVPVQRAVHEWAARLAAASYVPPAAPDATGDSSAPFLSSAQTDQLLMRRASDRPAPDPVAAKLPASGPEAEECLARLQAFPIALVAQSLTPLQRGMRIRRFEVLLREAAPTLSGTAPLELLRRADDLGLGGALDQRVLGALLAWLDQHGVLFTDPPSQFSLNLSASSLADPDLPRALELAIQKAGIPPELLAFELDQSLWRRDRAHIERLGTALDALGAGLVIDNCTLDEYTADLLSVPAVRLAKIDRHLTRDLAASRVAQMRVAGLAQIARVAGVHTVAKQIDLAAEQEPLRALGVDFLQGFATAMPMPLDELARQCEEHLIVDDSAREQETPVEATMPSEAASSAPTASEPADGDTGSGDGEARAAG